MLHTESDTNQRNVTFIDLAGIVRDLKAILTFFYGSGFILSKPAAVPERASNFSHPSSLTLTDWK